MALVIAAVLALSGCSGGSKGRSSGTTAPASGASSTVATVFTGEGSTQFCTLLRGFNQNTERITPSLNDPDALRQALAEVQMGIAQASSQAPPEIRADLSLLSGLYSQLVAALAGANFDFTKLPPDTLSRLSAPEVQAAATRLQAYAANVCKVSG